MKTEEYKGYTITTPFKNEFTVEAYRMLEPFYEITRIDKTRKVVSSLKGVKIDRYDAIREIEQRIIISCSTSFVTDDSEADMINKTKQLIDTLGKQKIFTKKYEKLLKNRKFLAGYQWSVSVGREE